MLPFLLLLLGLLGGCVLDRSNQLCQERLEIRLRDAKNREQRLRQMILDQEREVDERRREMQVAERRLAGVREDHKAKLKELQEALVQLRNMEEDLARNGKRRQEIDAEMKVLQERQKQLEALRKQQGGGEAELTKLRQAVAAAEQASAAERERLKTRLAQLQKQQRQLVGLRQQIDRLTGTGPANAKQPAQNKAAAKTAATKPKTAPVKTK